MTQEQPWTPVAAQPSFCLLMLLVAVLLGVPEPAHAASTIKGRAHVIDGDTLDVGGHRIRLADIDAPELAQTCKGPSQLRRCGKLAAEFLSARIEGQQLSCIVEEIDASERSVASCKLHDVDLSTLLIREGYAFAFVKFSQRFVELEAEARKRRAGLWRAQIEPPWDYRARRWSVAAQQAPAGCAIKGNIGRSGERIYHMPWDPWYGRTKLSEGKGERRSTRAPGRCLAVRDRPPFASGGTGRRLLRPLGR
jgi:endonuclease YncB( thermonuclease family)